MRQRKLRLWQERAIAVAARLREPLDWYPFPLIVSFALVLLLTGHILFGPNPRAGNPADIITFPAQPIKDSAIWMSVTPIGDDIVVTTGRRKVFRWKQAVRNLTDLKPFIHHLKELAQGEIESAALAKRAQPTQMLAVIAADQRLRYLHIRPIIYALAEAGIAQYAFETQNPVVAAAETHEDHPVHH